MAKYGGGATRLATMPIGMIKDFATGGLIGLTTNFVPRVKNIKQGDSIFNHAQGKPEDKKEQVKNANNTEANKG